LIVALKTDFTVGQLVWLFWPSPPRRQKFQKLQWQWRGPWRIESFRSDVVVNLVHTTKQWRQVVHMNRLSPCKGTPKILNSIFLPRSLWLPPPKFPLRLSTSPAQFRHLPRLHRILRRSNDRAGSVAYPWLWSHTWWRCKVIFESYPTTAKVTRSERCRFRASSMATGGRLQHR